MSDNLSVGARLRLRTDAISTEPVSNGTELYLVKLKYANAMFERKIMTAIHDNTGDTRIQLPYYPEKEGEPYQLYTAMSNLQQKGIDIIFRTPFRNEVLVYKN